MEMREADVIGHYYSQHQVHLLKMYPLQPADMYCINVLILANALLQYCLIKIAKHLLTPKHMFL